MHFDKCVYILFISSCCHFKSTPEQTAIHQPVTFCCSNDHFYSRHSRAASELKARQTCEERACCRTSAAVWWLEQRGNKESRFHSARLLNLCFVHARRMWSVLSPLLLHRKATFLTNCLSMPLKIYRGRTVVLHFPRAFFCWRCTTGASTKTSFAFSKSLSAGLSQCNNVQSMNFLDLSAELI